MLDVLAVFIGSGPVTHRIAQLRDRALAGDEHEDRPARRATAGDRAPKLFGRDLMMHRESVLRGAEPSASK